MKIILIALVLFTAQISLASECIRTSQIRNYNALDNQTLELDAGKTDYVMTVNYCSELTWTHSIGFDTFGSPRVCAGDRLLVIDTFTNKIIQSCLVRQIDKI